MLQETLTMKPMTRKVIGYIRVSSEEQVKNYSLETQKAHIEQYCQNKGFELVKIFREEGASAKTLDRPALTDLLNFCDKSKDITGVVVHRVDRLSRQTSDYLLVRAKLAGLGIEFLSVSEPTGETPADKFIETMLAATAQFDNDNRSVKAIEGHRARFKAGWGNGKPRVGYKSGLDDRGKLIHIVDPEMFPKVLQAWQLMATGTKTLREMADYMTEIGVRTFWGGKKCKITHQGANRIFRDKYYCGYINSVKHPEWGEVKGNHEPMISEEMFWKVQAIITGRSTQKNIADLKRNIVNPDFPLRRVTFCTCGSPMTGGWSRSKTGKRHAYYFCRLKCKASQMPDGRKVIRVDDMDGAMVNLLRNITPVEESVKLFTLMLHREYDQRYAELKRAQSKSEKKIADIEQLQLNLAKGHAEGRYSDEVFDQLKKENENKLIATQIVNNEVKLDQYKIDEICNFANAFLKDLAKPYLIGDVGQKRLLLGLILEEKLVWENGAFQTPHLARDFALIEGVVATNGNLGGDGGIRTHVSLAAQGFSKPSHWATMRRLQFC